MVKSLYSRTIHPVEPSRRPTSTLVTVSFSCDRPSNASDRFRNRADVLTWPMIIIGGGDENQLVSVADVHGYDEFSIPSWQVVSELAT
jgi:hypothetical protein